MNSPVNTDGRVLVLMPTARDGERTRLALSGSGLVCAVCCDMAELCREIARGAGTLLLTEEALAADRDGCLMAALRDQPTWSAIPLVILAREGAGGRDNEIRESLNVSLIERPVRIRSLLSVVRAALRARRHQYAVRDHLAERQRAVEALRAADRRKDEFIAVLAHELRNPLAPLRNDLEVLRLMGNLPDQIVQIRDRMDRQLTHMVRLVDDLLDISRINQNKMELRRARVSLSEVVAHAVETARPLIDEAGHELTIDFPAAPVYLDADLVRLSQVFSNLLSNSAKYTPRGGRVWLSAERAGDQVVVSVRDTGIGIPASALLNIFDMFSQVDRSVERSTGGLGIGLALVKGLVEMHGGKVTVASEGEGKGSTFTVTLPVVAAQTQPAAETLGTDLAAARVVRRVLIVDDNRDGAQSMAEMLALLGHEVRQAHDGIEAIDAAGRERPEVILMDVGMPRLNGLDATRRIREQPWGQGIVIVALTGWGQENDRERSREAGCDGHLVKPVKLDDLGKLLGVLRDG